MAAVVASLSALVIAACLIALPADAAPSGNEVLILGSSVNGGTGSLEAQAVTALGLTPVVVDDATWRGLSTAQFSSYRALVIGDTGGNSPATFQAATDTASVWGPVVNANQIIIGTDPVDHQGQGGGQLVQKGIAFAADAVGKTGFYVSLGDAYSNDAPGTPIPLLDALEPSGFTTQGAACHNDAHIAVEHPAVSGLTDASLSNWGCSVHNQFDTWPARFQVLAMARNRGNTYTGADGSTGVAYILAAGDGIRTFPLSADPTSATVEAGQTHTITAQLLNASDRSPVQGATLRAATETRSGSIVIRDLLRCSTTLCQSDASGQVRFSYTSPIARADTVVVFRDANANDDVDPGEEQVRVAVEWTAPPEPPSRGPGATYVALGDSYSSGEGLQDYEPNTKKRKKNECHRSTRAYPQRALQQPNRGVKAVDRRFRACSGAVIDDFYHLRGFTQKDFLDDPGPYSPEEPAQIVWLGSKAKYVTLSVSGNDVLFGDILEGCNYRRLNRLREKLPPQSFIEECDEIIDAGFRVLPTLRERLEKLYTLALKRAPSAQIRVLNYPTLFPHPNNYEGYRNQACEVSQLGGYILDRHVTRFRALNRALNGEIGEAITAVRASAPEGRRVRLLNIESAFGDHTISCGDKGRPEPWIAAGRAEFGTGPSKASFHPNKEGQCQMALAVNTVFGWRGKDPSC